MINDQIGPITLTNIKCEGEYIRPDNKKIYLVYSGIRKRQSLGKAPVFFYKYGGKRMYIDSNNFQGYWKKVNEH